MKVVFIALIVGCLIWAFGSDGPHATSTGYTTRRDAAIEAARYRYAQGLLSRDEYQHLMADLGVPLAGDPPPPLDFWLAPVAGMFAWPWLFLLLDDLRARLRTHEA